MASLNKVMIIGNLGQDPELRYTQNQVPVVTLNIATKDTWVKDGQKQENTEWHRVIVWNKQAENCARYLSKGKAVYVEGRIQTRSWEDKNGQKRFTTEISATTVQFLSSPGQGAGGSPSQRSNQDPFAGEMDTFPPSQDFNFMPSSDKSSMNSNGLGSFGNHGLDPASGLDEIPF